MNINALLMDETDNVVTCVEVVTAGQKIVYRKGSTTCSLTAEETIPYCHKIALADLAEGDEVIKYGELLGKLSVPVAKGHLIDHNNLFSVPRDYESEFIN